MRLCVRARLPLSEPRAGGARFRMCSSSVKYPKHRAPRAWVPVNGSVTAAEPGSFSVCSYNVLGPMHGLSKMHDYAPLAAREWKHRRITMAAEIKSYKPDLLLLQEVTLQTFVEDWQPLAEELGLDSERGHYVPQRPLKAKLLDPRGQGGLGVATFVNTNKFKIEGTRAVVFRDELPELMNGVVPKSSKWVNEVLKLKEGASLALLRHRETGLPVLLANVHIHFNPWHVDFKTTQVALLCSAMRTFADDYRLDLGKTKVICAGDFNSIPEVQPAFLRKGLRDELQAEGTEPALSGVMQLLSTGSVPCSHPEHPATTRQDAATAKQDAATAKHDATTAKQDAATAKLCDVPIAIRSKDFTTSGLPSLRSTYAASELGQPCLTTKAGSFTGAIDHIFVGDGVQVRGLLDMPLPSNATKEEIRAFPDIPNDLWPSDHLAIGAILKLE